MPAEGEGPGLTLLPGKADPTLPDAPPGRARTRRQSRLTAAQRRLRVLQLIASGRTPDEVSESMATLAAERGQPNLRVSPKQVVNTVNAEMKKLADGSRENIEGIRQQRLFELDQLKKALWTKAVGGNIPAIREAAKIILMQAKIEGAEAPQKVDHTGKVDLSMTSENKAEIDRMERAWLEAGDVVDADYEDVTDA